MRTVVRIFRCALLAAALPVACTSGAVGPPPLPPVDWHAFEVHRVLDGGPAGPTPRERVVAETYAAAVASPGFAQLVPTLDPWAHFAFPGMSDARGRDAVVHAHEVLFGAVDSRGMTTGRVWRTESTQAVEWTLTGVHARAWMGLAATQRPVTVKGLTLLWTKDDGSITDVHVYFPVVSVKSQLGAGPKDPAAVASPPAAPVQESAPHVFDQSGAPDEQRNVAVVRSELDALEGSSDSAYVATMTDDVEVLPMGVAQPMRGKEDLLAYFKSIHKAIGQLDTTIDNAWGVERFAIVEYLITGEQLGPIGGIPAHRDRVVRLHIVDVAEIRDGKIARIWRYDNPSEIATPQ